MPLTRSQSHSSGSNRSQQQQHATNLFSGFQNWRRRRASTSIPASPMTVTSASSPAPHNNNDVSNNYSSNNSDNDQASFLASLGLSPYSSDQSRLHQQSNQPNQLYHLADGEVVVASSLASSRDTAPTTTTTITLNSPPPPSRTVASTAIPPSVPSTIGENDNDNNAGDSSLAVSQPSLHIRLLPNIGMNSRCFMFDIIDRVLTPTTVLQMGRYSERHVLHNRLSFKSKVVSRIHAELWMDEEKKIFIRDTGSSSGTFVNRVRLSPSNETSIPLELKDGDAIQLGVDYQGGLEQVYRSVKIRLEVDRNMKNSSSYSRQAFQQLRQHLMESSHSPSDTGGLEAATLKEPVNHGITATTTNINSSAIQECCICLYAIAPLQALFVAPCSHVFHFKCLRPIVFQNYPGFSCPLCRNYYDLEASVAVEVSDVLESMRSAPNHPYLPPSSSNDTEGGLPLLASSSIMQTATSPSSQPSHQTSSGYEDSNDSIEEDRQQHNETGRRIHSQATGNIDGLLLSNTLVDPSMLDQEGVVHSSSNLASSL